MKIGIIGAGNIGGNLTRRLRALGHDVSVANSRGPETLAALAKETGARPVTVRDAARGKDVVIVTIPVKNIPALPKDLFAGADDTVVVDTGNYYPKRRELCCACSMSWDSTASMPARSMSRGGSSQILQSTELISTPAACDAHCPKPTRNDRPGFAQWREARRPRREAARFRITL